MMTAESATRGSPGSPGPALRSRTAACWLSLSVLLAAGRAPAQESPDDRFLYVKEWQGRLEVTVSASGTVDSLTATVDYSIARHLNFTFFLDAPGAPMGWWNCSTETSAGSIEELYTTTYKPTGCVNKVIHSASGRLDPVPGDPTIEPPLPPCLAHAFQLQIIPLPPAGTYTTWGFADSITGEQTLESLGGGNCIASSITNEATYGFFGVDTSPVCQGIGCLELPATGYNIRQHWSYDGTESTTAGQVPVHYDVRLDLTGCGEKVEVVVKAIDYESWRPQGGRWEDEEGNQLVIEASLKGEGDCPTDVRARRFVFELEEVSSEPGVCMNYPPPGAGGSGRPDLAFMPDFNAGPWQAIAPFAARIVTRDGQYRESPRAYLSSFDWGGHAKLKVTAEFDDREPIVGYLEGDQEVTSIPIPRRDPGSKIAAAWRAEAGAEGLADQDDSELDPVGDGHRGDGLFLYEEYRGFYEGSDLEHIHGHARKKDLFVIDTATADAGIELFRKATGLEVHGKLRGEQADAQRVVNFNRSEGVGNSNDQHALRLERTDPGPDLLGNAVGGPALPAFIQRIQLKSAFGPQSIRAVVGGSPLVVTQEAFVIAHELAHGCNIFHHGEGGLKLKLIAKREDGQLVYTTTSPEGDVIVSLAKESCGGIESILPASETDHRLKVGVATKGGTHSGVQSCLLRYNLAQYYLSEDEVTIWFHGGGEPPGFTLCDSRRGTGVNECGRCPEPRYGHAVVGRCKRQLCVDDSEDHTPGQPPEPPLEPACDSGGGAGGEDQDPVTPVAVADGGGAGLADAPPRVALAVNERRAVTAYRGWPLLVTFEVIPPAFGSAEPAPDFVVSGGAGPWTAAVRLVLEQAGVAQPLWPLAPLATAPDRLALSPADLGLAAWWILPTDTAALAPGEYLLSALLDTTGSLEGWQGVARAEPVRVTVAPEPAPLGPELEVEKAVYLARFESAQGDLTPALRRIEDLLARQPGNLAGLVSRAELLELAGDDRAALAGYEEALEEFDRLHPDAYELPASLIRSHQEVQERVSAGPGGGEVLFARGDANQDGSLNISDPVFILAHLFLGQPGELDCAKSADADDSGGLNLTDAIYALNFLFTGGRALPPPRGACGADPTADGLECERHAACAEGW
jgi:hypothetical protein